MNSFDSEVSPNSAETPVTNFVEVQDKDSEKQGNKQKNQGVILFEEWLSPSLELLNDAQLGKVLREFFKWVWYKSKPNLGSDKLLNFAFRSISAKAQKNFEYYDLVREKRSEAGKKGAKSRWNDKAKMANANFANETDGKNGITNTSTNSNTSTNTSVSIESKGKNIADKSATLDQRKQKFVERIKKANIEWLYPDKMLEDFFNYWTEMNENGVKMRFEMEKVFEVPKRLKKWAENDQNRNFKPYNKGSFNQEQKEALIKGFMTAKN